MLSAKSKRTSTMPSNITLPRPLDAATLSEWALITDVEWTRLGGMDFFGMRKGGTVSMDGLSSTSAGDSHEPLVAIDANVDGGAERTDAEAHSLIYSAGTPGDLIDFEISNFPDPFWPQTSDDGGGLLFSERENQEEDGLPEKSSNIKTLLPSSIPPTTHVSPVSTYVPSHDDPAVEHITAKACSSLEPRKRRREPRRQSEEKYCLFFKPWRFSTATTISDVSIEQINDDCFRVTAPMPGYSYTRFDFGDFESRYDAEKAAVIVQELVDLKVDFSGVTSPIADQLRYRVQRSWSTDDIVALIPGNKRALFSVSV